MDAAAELALGQRGEEVRVGRELEGLDPVRLQAERSPDPLHRADGETARLGHRALARSPGEKGSAAAPATRVPVHAIGQQALRRPAGRAGPPADPRQSGDAISAPCRHARPGALRPAAGCPCRHRPARIRARSANPCAVRRRAAKAARSSSLNASACNRCASTRKPPSRSTETHDPAGVLPLPGGKGGGS